MSPVPHRRTVVLKRGLLHVETPLGIVNIRVGLRDAFDRPVDSIEILANRYVGEPAVMLDGYVNNRLIQLPATGEVAA